MTYHCLVFNLAEFGHLPRSTGVHRIATWLRYNGFDAEVVDWANHWSLEQLKEFFQSRYNSKTKFVGFSHMFSIWSDTTEKFCHWIKLNYPDIFILSGSSVKASFFSNHIDYYVQGFGEHALTEFLKWKLSNGPRPRFDLQKINGKPFINANDQYPAFPMSSLSVEYETRDFIQPTEWLGIESARGCKFKCNFCNFPVLGVKGDYSRDAEDFEKEIKSTHDKFGVTNYIIVDETFNDRTEKITKFADVVEKLDFNPYFTAFIRADLMISREREKEELLRMNVLGQFYGVESFNTQSAKAVGKGMKSEQMQQGLIEAKNYFNSNSDNLYRGTLGLIVGLPHETFSSLEFTRQWLVDHWQGQAYTVYRLVIPQGELTKPSAFSLNYTKYGYRELDISTHNATSNDNKVKPTGLGDEMLWQNDNMNIHQADEITNQWVNQKYTLDFRQSCFSLAHRLKDYHSIKDRVNLNYHQLESNRNNDISEYVNSKLNYTKSS